MKKLIWLMPLLVGIVIMILFQTVFLLGFVPSESMEPTLKENSLILGVRTFGELSSGDVVVFEHEGTVYVKRIAAGPGEEITVDGIRHFVPPNAYFMLGDNSENSYDSRYWEYPYVSEEDIIAKVILPHNKQK